MERYLSLSGGALQEAKCSYHYLHFMFTPSGLPVVQGGVSTPTLTIHNASNTSLPLQPLSSYTPHKTLGVMKSPSGSSVSSYKYLQQKNKQHIINITTTPLDESEVELYYLTIYIPSMIYSLPSVTLSDPQCS